MDKRTFWNRVHVGAERIDAMAREVFCHLFLTMEGSDSAAAAAPGAIGDTVGVGEGRAGGNPRRDSGGAEVPRYGRASEMQGARSWTAKLIRRGGEHGLKAIQ